MSLRKLIITVFFVAQIFSNLGLTALRQGSIGNITIASWNKGVELVTKGNRSTINIVGTRYYMRLYSLCQRIIDKRVNQSVIKLNNGYLNYLGYGYLNYVNYEQNLKRDYLFCEQYAERISLFQKRLQSEKIPVVFVMAPGKSHIIDLQIPRGCKPEITNILADYLLKKLEEKKVPFFDTRSIFKENSDEPYRLFFKGDHHWKPEYALIAYQKFWKLYSDKISEIPNVNLDWINHIQRQQFPFNLGEQFQINQSGEYYTDYEQSITHYMPQFDTDITVSIPYQKYLIRENFESSGVSDYYMHNPPLKYSINHKIKYGKIVLIKDSFGLPWFGFLTLSTHETYMFDLRSYRSSPESYIKNIQPDIVIILYHPGALSDHENYSSAFNF